MMKYLYTLLVIWCGWAQSDPLPTLRVGSKPFTEGYILGELIAQTIEETGEAQVERKLGLGGAGIIFRALTTSSLDIAPEYLGTISHAMLNRPDIHELSELQLALRPYGLDASLTMSFASSQGLVMQGDHAKKLGIQRISQLSQYPRLRVGFHHDFLARQDGWQGLMTHYRLPLSNVMGLSHTFAYQALDNHIIDLSEAYLTDAKIALYNLTILEDDKNFFPDYTALLLTREGLQERFPVTWSKLTALANTLNVDTIRQLNQQVEIEGKSYEEVATHFLHPEMSFTNSSSRRWWRLTKETTFLVLVAVFASILCGLPLGILSTRHLNLGRAFLTGSGLIQTIPSMALLCLFIPLFGIGTTSAIVALVLYGLLPIIRGTYLGLSSIDPELLETARALGLSPMQRLFRVELPLAAPSIMAGIKTSATISVGTATLAALIGAGGYGDFILTGLSVNSTKMIMTGVWSAALFSLLLQGLLELIDRCVVPASLR